MHLRRVEQQSTLEGNGMNKYRLGNNLIEAIEAHGMTQKEFAEAMNLHENTVYGWTRGKRVMSCWALYRAAKILNIPMEKIMEGVE